MASTARKTSGRQETAEWGPETPIDLWPADREPVTIVEQLWRQVRAAADRAGGGRAPVWAPVLSAEGPLVGAGAR